MEGMKKLGISPYQPLSYDGSRLVEKIHGSAFSTGNENTGIFLRMVFVVAN
jgi:hypothetical protein